ncbi:MAG: hypothetical protein IK085_10510, partial [Clostridia bacterium]|nr:hypothetical protein [Clostridia bacterium]
FFLMFFVQSFQVATGKRDKVDVTFPTVSSETELQFDGRYNTTRTTTTVITTTEPPTEEGYIPAGSDEDVWSIAFGGTGSDIVRSSYYCSNGDFLVCGNTSSADRTMAHCYGYGWAETYAFVARYSSNGTLRWINSIGGNNITVAYDTAELSDGSIVCVGYTLATDLIEYAPVSQNTIDAFIYRYSSTGDVLSKYVAEGTGYDYFYSVAATPDGGYVVGGSSTSHDGIFNMTSSGAVIMKFDSSNQIVSSFTLNGTSGGAVYDVCVDVNSTVFAACVTVSSDGDFAQFSGIGAGSNDSVILKYSSDLSTLRWSCVIASSGNDRFEHICADDDGGCVAAGYFLTKNNTLITDGFFDGCVSYGKEDGYAVKINSLGTVTDRRSFGGSENDYVSGVYKAGSKYVFCGYSKSSDYMFRTLGNLGGYDSFITVVDASDFSGSALSVHPIAGTDMDCAYSVCGSSFTAVVAGTSSSTDEFFWTTDPMNDCENTGFAVKYSLA